MINELYQVCDDDIVSLSSYMNYIDSINKISNSAISGDNPLLFRGQPVDKELIPAIARIRWKTSIASAEKFLLQEFARMSTPYTKHGHDDAWDRLALAQHYGLPTRLLDWTYSATAALWFAVANEPTKDDSGNPNNTVVWILKPKENDFLTFPTDIKPLETKKTRIFKPRIIAERISAQSGLFTLHYLNHDMFVPLEKHSRFSKKLTKIPIKAKYFRKLRNQLNTCGVNNATMFPDLVGLCQYLVRQHAKDPVLTVRRKIEPVTS